MSQMAGARAAPWLTRLAEILDDGPRPMNEAISEAAHAVPPGRAIRRYGKNHTGRRNLSPEHQIQKGAEWIVRESLRGVVLRGRVAVYSDGEREYLVLTDVGRAVFLDKSTRPPFGIRADWTLVDYYQRHHASPPADRDGTTDPDGIRPG